VPSLTALVLTGLAVGVGEALHVRTRRSQVAPSLGPAVALGAVVWLGPWAALPAWLGTLGAPGWAGVPRRLGRSVDVALATLASGGVYLAAGGSAPPGPADVTGALGPVLAADAAGCAVLVLLLALAPRLAAGPRGGQGLGDLPRALLGSVVSAFVGGVLGGLAALLWVGGAGPLAAALVLVPLGVAWWAFAQEARQQEAYDAVTRTLVRAVEAKDAYTRGHSERVAAAAARVGRRLGMPEARVAALRHAGLLHDVGKIAVPGGVLRKSGPLTPEESHVMRAHAVHGLDVVRPLSFLAEARAGIVHHHERVDGRGYPLGLSGDAIPEFARIVAVVDAYDAMTSGRPYQPPIPAADAVRELRRAAGSHLDPRFVEVFLETLDRVPEPVGTAGARA